MAQTNLDVVTGSRLEQALSENWDAMKTWVLSNIDNSNLMTQIKGKLDTANRQIIGTTGTAKADALVTAVDAMVRAFTDRGINMSGITTAQFAQCIASLSNASGCYILDTDGLRWTAASWASERERLGHDPATRRGILLDNPDHPFLIASKHYGTSMFGTYNHTIPNLQAFTNGVAGEPRSGEYNSRKIMAATNPENCKPQYKVTYFDGMTENDLVDKDVVFFPSQSTLTTWANSMGLGKMQTIGESMIYCYPHTTDGKWVAQYCKTGVTTIQFANREAMVPYADNYGMVGCTALELCYAHHEYEGDTTHWRLGSLFELMMCYLNRYDINACRVAMGEQNIPSAESWSCLQYGNNNEYYLSLGTGASGNYAKNNKYYVLPIASN